jgi:hypothetical protein
MRRVYSPEHGVMVDDLHPRSSETVIIRLPRHPARLDRDGWQPVQDAAPPRIDRATAPLWPWIAGLIAVAGIAVIIGSHWH